MASDILPLLLLAMITLTLVSRPLVQQASAFLQQHGGPALTCLQISSVTLVFAAAGAAVIAAALCGPLPWPGAVKLLLLLAWGVPMVLLDMRNCWLPLCYTNGFWLSGLLLTLLPGTSQTLNAALVGSGGMFLFLSAFHYGAKILRGTEGFGLGDVHLIAALCAWFPWSLASLFSGAAFLLFILSALLTNKTTQPYAPWLFSLLAVLAAGFPQLIMTGVL